MDSTFSYAQLQSPKHFLQDAVCNAGGTLIEVKLLERLRHGVVGGVYRHEGIRQRGAVYGVLDGVGGCREPKRASQIGADELTSIIRKTSALPADERGFQDCLRAANVKVWELGIEPGTRRSLGAAAAVAVWIPWATDAQEMVPGFLANVGDTMAWRWDGEKLHELVSMGRQAKVIRNYLGLGDGFEIDFRRIDLERGRDVVVLATDGVTKAIGLAAVNEIAHGCGGDVEELPRRIVFAAKANGSSDDISVMAVQVE